jgi:hypothetical protein
VGGHAARAGAEEVRAAAGCGWKGGDEGAGVAVAAGEGEGEGVGLVERKREGGGGGWRRF